MLRKKLARLWGRIKVQKQLIFIFFTAIFIPVIIIGNYLIYNSRTLLLGHYEDLARSDNYQVKSILYDLTSGIYEKANTLASDSDLRQLLSTEYTSQTEAMQALTSYEGFNMPLARDVYIHEVSIYTFNETLPDGRYIHPVTDEIRETDWFQRLSSSVTPFWSEGVLIDDYKNEEPAICFCTRIFLTKVNSYAIMRLTISNNQLRNRLNNSTQETVIWLNDDDPFYYSHSRQKSIGKILSSYNMGSSQYYLGKVELSDQQALGCISALPTAYSDDTFHIASLNTDGYPYLNKITAVYAAILLLILIASSIFVLLYSRHFSRRVITLRETMHKVSQGEYDSIIDTFDGEDEISEAFYDLHSMVQDILKKEASYYEAELRNKELISQQTQMRFEMLSSQINPHFLYNTLETIRMRSLRAGNKEVANAIKLLGKSMRYVLDNTMVSATSLARELEQIETYITIQLLRFHDKFSYNIRIPVQMNTEKYKIMPLLIQPIVENAILHGLREVEENGHLIIHVSEHGKQLHIKIFDNGCGMTKEKIADVIENISEHPKDSAKSIGLYNVNQRIRLRYGEEYGLVIKSKKNCGTLVTMTIPALEYIGGTKNEIIYS